MKILLPLLFLCAFAAQAATFVQEDAAGGGTVTVTSLGAAVNGNESHTGTTVSGELLVVMATGTDEAGTGYTIASTPSLTFTAAAIRTNNIFQSSSAIWTAPVTTGASTTVTITNCSFDECKIKMVSVGNYNTSTVSTGSYTDGNVDSEARAGALAGTLSTAADAGDVVFGVFGGNSALTDMTPGTGWTELDEAVDGSSNGGNFSYKIGAETDFDMNLAVSGAVYPGWAAAAAVINVAP